MKIETSYINRTEGYRFGDEVIDVDDTIFDPESPTLIGDIFRYSQKEYGRCTGKVHIDTRAPGDPEGVYSRSRHVGWVFESRQAYEDTGEPYLREVWVILLARDETIREREHHYIS